MIGDGIGPMNIGHRIGLTIIGQRANRQFNGSMIDDAMQSPIINHHRSMSIDLVELSEVMFAMASERDEEAFHVDRAAFRVRHCFVTIGA